MLNVQPTKELNQFQKLVIQDIYIRQLNKKLDEMEWENEKKDAIIEMKEKEIAELQKITLKQSVELMKTQREFKEYLKKIKETKVNLEKHDKQQTIINTLRQQLLSTEKRLKVSHRLNELMAKQNKQTKL